MNGTFETSSSLITYKRLVQGAFFKKKNYYSLTKSNSKTVELHFMHFIS